MSETLKADLFIIAQAWITDVKRLKTQTRELYKKDAPLSAEYADGQAAGLQLAIGAIDKLLKNHGFFDQHLSTPDGCLEGCPKCKAESDDG
jgi:hypothetical protein